MAGIGFELRKIYGRKTLASSIGGSIYATMTAVGPSVIVAVLILFLKFAMDRADITELENRFFMSSFTYIFLIAVLIAALFSTVVSRYVSDCVFHKDDRALGASVFGVMTAASVLSGGAMLVLCVGMFIASDVPVYFLLLYYLLGILVANAYVVMTYVSALKEYKEVTLSYFAGILLAVIVYFLAEGVWGMHPVVAAYAALTCGYALLNGMLIFWCVNAFGIPQEDYFGFLHYFVRFPKLLMSGLFYVLGFYSATIIYWNHADIRERVSIFWTAPAYDLAMFLAILVNMSALVIFVVKVETSFFDKYVAYLSALNMGSYHRIKKEQESMTNSIRCQLFFVYEVQLIITVVLICLANVFFPYLNISVQVLNLFMILSMGVYTVFCMYFTIIFLYYFEDHTAACIAPCIFLGITAILAAAACQMGRAFYPLPLLAGGYGGWMAAFGMLRYRLMHLDSFLMCKGAQEEYRKGEVK